MNHFKTIRDRIISELEYHRDCVLEGEIYPNELEDLLFHISDLYRIKYGGEVMFQDELLFLFDIIHDNVDFYDMTGEEIYEVITRVLILMGTIDDRAEGLI